VQYAFDGDLTTRWSSGQNQSGGETFRLDLGAVTSVSEMTLEGAGGADFPAAYTLEVSADGQAYEQVAAGAGAPFTRIQFAQKNARYLRVTQTGTNANQWWSIAEITIQP
jgi:glucosylceramidase